MIVLPRTSALWNYLTPDLQGLIMDGEVLIDEVDSFKGNVSDYSFLVFPFSKAYEGFLKRLFLDLGLMREDEYYGDDIRIGRVLNPHYVQKNFSLYEGLCLHKKGGKELTHSLWEVWRKGRNQVFHYFPHNFRRLSLDEALSVIHSMLEVMEQAVGKCDLSDTSPSAGE
jgi:hypothetical protein